MFWSQPDHSNTSHLSPHSLTSMRNEKLAVSKFEAASTQQRDHVKPQEERVYLSGESDEESDNNREDVGDRDEVRDEEHEEAHEEAREEVHGDPDTEGKIENDEGHEDEPKDLSEGHDNEPLVVPQDKPGGSPPQAGESSEVHEHDFHLDGKIDTKETWEHMKGLPEWMKEYLTWHQEQRKLMNKDNWKDFKYLVLQCVREDPHCGGTSDRLKPIPLLMFMAHKYKRIFLIWWTRPCALEEFLVPNAINWTVPDYLPLSDYDVNGKLIAKSDGLKVWVKKDEMIIRSRMQTYDGGQLMYENMTTSTYNEIYHDLFRLLFEPSPAIAKILRREMGEAHLVPGEYAVAHYRAFYARATRKEKAIAEVAVNAANCASMLRPGGPIYFASDSLFALANVRAYAKEYNYNIVTIENQEPLHLDKAGNWSERQPSDFYSVFVDLYLMGMGRCVTYGQGGFGKFGLLLGYNATCTGRHFYKKNMQKCEWTKA